MAIWHRIQRSYLKRLSSTYGSAAGLMEKLAWLAVVTGFLGAFVCWGYQGYVWLKTGAWQPLSIVTLYGYFRPAGWAGLETIINGVANINLGFIAIMVAWLVKQLCRLLGSVFKMSAMEVSDQVTQVRRKELGLD